MILIYKIFQNLIMSNKMITYFRKGWLGIVVLLLSITTFSCSSENENVLKIEKNSHIVLLGNNLASRMMNFGHFETELQLRYADSLLFIRNMCDGGNTPGFRPHSSRNSPWAFPGASDGNSIGVWSPALL